MQVRTRDGAVLEQRCGLLKAMAGSPLSREERLAKFRDCAAGMLSETAIEQVISRVDGLAVTRSSIRSLMNILRCAGQALEPLQSDRHNRAPA